MIKLDNKDIELLKEATKETAIDELIFYKEKTTTKDKLMKCIEKLLEEVKFLATELENIEEFYYE